MSDKNRLHHTLRSEFENIMVKDLEDFFRKNNVPDDAVFCDEWEGGLILEWYAIETDEEYEKRIALEKKYNQNARDREFIEYKRLKKKFCGWKY